MALTSEQLASVTSGNVIDSDGDKIGGVGQVYLDDQTGDPSWRPKSFSVRFRRSAGLLGRRRTGA